MADLQQEIEARKSRIAELRRQREAHAAQVSTSKQVQFDFVVPSAPVLQIPPVTMYTKVTEPLRDIKPIEVETKQEEVVEEREEFTINLETSNSLLAFADHAYRAIARSRVTTAFSTYLEPVEAKSSSDPIKKLDSVLEIASNAFKVSLNPHFKDLLAVQCSERRIEIYSLSAFDKELNYKPEFTLRSPTVISTDIVFHPQNPHILFCGGVSGQLMAWDLKGNGGRYELLPQIRSNADGQRVMSLQFPDRGNTLISLSENGVVSVWPSGDLLAKPKHQVLLDEVLRSALQGLRIGVLVPFTMNTCFPTNFSFGLGYGTGISVLSTVSGNLLTVPTLPSANSVGSPDFKHDAPVVSMDFRPAEYVDAKTGKQFVVLCTAGMDWKLRFWLVSVEGIDTPKLVAETKVDIAVTKVKWHPTSSSSLFIVGENQCHVFDLNVSMAAPVVVMNVEGVSDLAIGEKLVLGGTNVKVCALPIFSNEEWIAAGR